jgi:hypothetical protein
VENEEPEHGPFKNIGVAQIHNKTQSGFTLTVFTFYKNSKKKKTVNKISCIAGIMKQDRRHTT